MSTQITPSLQESKNSNADSKYKMIIDEQNYELSSIIDIANFYNAENDKLKQANTELTNKNNWLIEQSDNLKNMYYLQTILFLLFIVTLFWFFYCQ